MRGLFISKSWILSKTAQRVYLCCALLAIAELGLIWAANAALMAAEAAELRGGARTLVHVLMLPAVAGTATLFVAMWYFWFGFDKSNWIKKACWFFALLFVPPFSTVLYYFFVYRRAPVLRETSAGEKHFAAVG
ncbi:MAG TPA: hypothetical protein VE734_06525 [Terriglobales bacterium]|nr:hypothetical protein [Terriglobales bacterium]